MIDNVGQESWVRRLREVARALNWAELLEIFGQGGIPAADPRATEPGFPTRECGPGSVKNIKHQRWMSTRFHRVSGTTKQVFYHVESASHSSPSSYMPSAHTTILDAQYFTYVCIQAQKIKATIIAMLGELPPSLPKSIC